MKNVSSSMLKKCIFMDFEEFKDLIINVTGGLKRVEYEPDGIYRKRRKTPGFIHGDIRRINVDTKRRKQNAESI